MDKKPIAVKLRSRVRSKTGRVEWYAIYKENGSEVWVPLDRESVRTKIDAEEKVKEIRGLLEEGLDPRTGSLTIDQWIEGYFDWCTGRKAQGTIRIEREILTTWRAWLRETFAGIRSPRDLQFKHFENYQSWRKNLPKKVAAKKGEVPQHPTRGHRGLTKDKVNGVDGKSVLVSQRRVNLEITVLNFLCGSYSTHKSRRILRSNPLQGIEKLREPKPATREISPTEFDLVERSFLESWQRKIGRIYALAFRLLYETGMRPSECLTLRWVDIDFATGHAKIQNSEVHTVKTFNPRAVMLSPAVTKGLSELKGTGKPLGEIIWPFNLKAMQLALRRAIQRANDNLVREGKSAIVPFGLYALRHSSVNNMFEAGADTKSVMQAHGHRSLTTTDKYTHKRQESVDAAYRRVWRQPDAVEQSNVIPIRNGSSAKRK